MPPCCVPARRLDCSHQPPRTPCGEAAAVSPRKPRRLAPSWAQAGSAATAAASLPTGSWRAPERLRYVGRSRIVWGPGCAAGKSAMRRAERSHSFQPLFSRAMPLQNDLVQIQGTTSLCKACRCSRICRALCKGRASSSRQPEPFKPHDISQKSRGRDNAPATSACFRHSPLQQALANRPEPLGLLQFEQLEGLAEGETDTPIDRQEMTAGCCGPAAGPGVPHSSSSVSLVQHENEHCNGRGKN